MRSRFTIVPVLHPLKADFVHILLATAKRVAPETDMDSANGQVIEASNLFFTKGANPRHIRLALSNALHLHGALTPETIFASSDFCGSADMAATIYSDLWAIKLPPALFSALDY